MSKRDFTSAKAKEALLHDMKDEFKLLEQYQPQKEVVDALLDGCADMVADIVNKEAEIAIRLYLLRAVIENITLRQAIIKYKVRTATTSDAPRVYTDGYPMLIQKMNGHQLYNTYEGYVRLVPREPIDDAAIDWRKIENDFMDFLIKGLEV